MSHKLFTDEAGTLLKAFEVGAIQDGSIRPGQIEQFRAVAGELLLNGAHAKRKGLIDLLVDRVI